MENNKAVISIHPPRAGRDENLPATPREATFQSTLPVRGGTKRVGTKITVGAISIHPPRAGRD